ncbi:MAG: penicillin-binding protein 1C [Burkholderiales bacterium 28-67-8]|nr:MAG: penicillin-binding protein 1C [Burkholderiales bacterium 28-67-8]
MARSLVLAALFVSTAATAALPSFEAVRAAHRPSDTTLLDRHGTPIQTLRTDMTVRRLAWLPLAEMSPALLHAIVLSEDRDFYRHSGVDWGALAHSAWSNAWNTRTRGASTLTMQLAGLLDDDLQRPADGRSLTQKVGQIVTARELEAHWSKTQILEAYLNRVAWRGELVGINALAQTLFGKHASGLDALEAAVAAALVRGPNASAAVVTQRSCGVLQAQGLSCVGVASLVESALTRRGGPPLGEQLAPHFARQVLAGMRRPGASLATTLDARTQRTANAALHQQLAELSGRNVEDGAVLVLDNASGEVLAWVGSSGELSDAAHVDGVLARRQPGSTLKPFVYGLAFEQRLITPASLIDDAPTQLATGSGLYLPQNYDRGFKGWVSARTALGASLNVPAVRVGAMLGADALWARLNALGFELPESGGYYGDSLALGSADVTLLALTNAYRALANGGVLSPVKWRRTAQAAAGASTASRPAGTRVASAAATYLVTDILSDNNARAMTFGLDSSLALHGPAAVKTGTSKDLRDNWCIGYTDRYTVGVWVGNASGEPMHDVSGVSGAAPVWRTLMQQLHAAAPSNRAAPPPGVVSYRARFEGDLEPARDEWALAGTEPATRRPQTAPTRSRREPPATSPDAVALAGGPFGIRTPRNGSLYALDPDMPPHAQKITFEGEAGSWWLDGKRLGQGTRWRWAPWPGQHELELRNGAGHVLQAVHFEVRGAGLKAAVAAR